MRKHFYLLTIALTGLLISCSEKKKEEKKAPEQKTDSINVATKEKDVLVHQIPPVAHPVYNNYARLLAGLPVSDTSQYYAISQTELWKKYAKELDSAWQIADDKRLSKMRAWQNTELAEANKTVKDVLYPLSGPDFLNVFTFFPNGKSYTLMALEPVGNVPSFTTMTDKQKGTYFLSVQQSLEDIFEKSYFITRKMLQHLQSDKANGTLPLMCLFMAKTGNTITDIERAWIDTSGTLQTAPLKSSNKPTYAVRVSFVTKADPTTVKTVTYIKADLEDVAFNRNKGLRRYLNNNYNNTITYLKSASYILHYKAFSGIRNILLDKTDFLLQDDTGIAYHFFDPKKWDIQLYGKYAKPVDDFSGVDQKDLQARYASDSTVKALPFSLGYHWGTAYQNMMRAIKKQ